MIASALTLFIYRMLGCMAVWVFIVMADRNIAPYSLSVAPDCQLTTKIRLMPTQSLIDLCRALRHVTSVCLIDSEADRDALLSLPSHPIPSDGVSVSGCQKWYICGPGPRNTRNKLSVYHAADTMPCVSPVAHTIIHRFIRYILPTRLIFCPSVNSIIRIDNIRWFSVRQYPHVYAFRRMHTHTAGRKPFTFNGGMHVYIDNRSKVKSWQQRKVFGCRVNL